MIIELSSYLRAEDCKGGEIVTFIDAGTNAEIESPEGKIKKVVNFKVEYIMNDGLNKAIEYTPNRSALAIFIEAWGKDSLAWIGRKFRVKLVQVNVFGKIKDSISPEILESTMNSSVTPEELARSRQVETIKM